MAEFQFNLGSFNPDAGGFNPDVAPPDTALVVESSNELFSGGYGDLNIFNNSILHTFKADQGKWTSYQQICQGQNPNPPKYAAALYIGRNTLIYTGGLNLENLGSQETKRVIINSNFGDRTEEVQDHPDMLEGRYLHSIVFADPVLYVLGGQSSPVNFLQSCESFTIGGTWQAVAPMNFPRSTFTATLFNQTIYVFGGFSGQRQLADSIEKYSIDSGNWELVNCQVPMFAGMLSIPINREKSEIWLIGGSDGKKSHNRVAKFAFSTDQAEVENTKLQQERSKASGCWIYNSYWVFGGGYCTGEVYKNGIWSLLEGFPKISDYETIASTSFNRERDQQSVNQFQHVQGYFQKWKARMYIKLVLHLRNLKK